MKFEETNHTYYCSENNYNIGGANGENYGRSEFDSWDDFKTNWLDENCELDCDLNLCFRWDINKIGAEKLELWLFFIFQRKGLFCPVWIKSIDEENIPEIEKFLNHQWKYLKNLWREIDCRG